MSYCIEISETIHISMLKHPNTMQYIYCSAKQKVVRQRLDVDIEASSGRCDT